MTLLVAGQETSAILLAWACAYLAAQPEIQSKAATEVGSVLGGRALKGPSDASGKLPYIEALVLEALRLMPPAYLVGRCTAMATTLPAPWREGPVYHLPKGTTVLVSPYVLHRDTRWWGDDAHEFKPERWLELLESKKGSSGGWTGAISGMGPHGAYIPFGAGQRNCIGTGFAMMEAVLVLGAVLAAVELRPPAGAAAALPAPAPGITLRPGPFTLRLVPR